jgi:hypothetical protein
VIAGISGIVGIGGGIVGRSESRWSSRAPLTARGEGTETTHFSASVARLSFESAMR